MKHRNRRKLFFPVGLIALSVFPIIGFQQIAKKYREKTAPEHAMEINFPCSKKDCFSEKFTGEYIRKQRAFISFILTKDSTMNYSILNNARRCLNRIKKNNDTLNGVRIALNDCNTYQDFITGIDYCGEKFPAAFMVHDNDILAMYITVDTSNYPKEKLNAMRRKGYFDY